MLRSGFGIMYSPILNNGATASNTGAIGFNAFTEYVSSVDGRQPFATLSNPFPNGFNTPTGARDGLLTFIGQAINAQVRSDRTPYVAQWHFNIQYEWHKDMLVDIGYAGSAGVKLPTVEQLNQLPDQFLTMGKGLERMVSNPFFGIIPATSALGAATIPAGQLLRPYPQFSKVIQTWGSSAHSSYHALQAKFRKRYRRGFQVLVAYTWSKMLDDNSGSFTGGNQSPAYMDNNRRDLDKSYSVFDIPHRLVASFEYELPFGAGRALLSDRRGVVNAIAGGWRLSGITTYAAGSPISITQSGPNQTGSFDGNARPNRTGIPIATPGSVEERIDNYLNVAAFSVAPPYTFGNAGRFIPDARGPGRAELGRGARQVRSDRRQTPCGFPGGGVQPFQSCQLSGSVSAEYRVRIDHVRNDHQDRQRTPDAVGAIATFLGPRISIRSEMIRQTVLAVVMCLYPVSCFGQAQTPLERVRALDLPTADGAVPVIYSVSAKVRAERYRTALETAHHWYEAQLSIRVPVTLAVLDQRDWVKVSSVPYPMPNSKAGLVTLPARMEDFPGFVKMGAMPTSWPR